MIDQSKALVCCFFFKAALQKHILKRKMRCLPLPQDRASKHGGGCRGCEDFACRASPGPSPGTAWGLLFPFIGCQVSAQDLYGQIQNPWKAGLGAVGTQMLPLPRCCNYATKLRKQRKSRM